MPDDTREIKYELKTKSSFKKPQKTIRHSKWKNLQNQREIEALE